MESKLKFFKVSNIQMKVLILKNIFETLKFKVLTKFRDCGGKKIEFETKSKQLGVTRIELSTV